MFYNTYSIIGILFEVTSIVRAQLCLQNSYQVKKYLELFHLSRVLCVDPFMLFFLWDVWNVSFVLFFMTLCFMYWQENGHCEQYLFSGASWTGWSFGPKENGHFRYLFKYLPILFMKKFGDQNHPHCFFREKFLKNPRKYFILSLNIYSHHKMGFM